MGRVIQEEVKTPLTDVILFGELKAGGRVKIGIHNGALHFDIERA